MDHDRRVNAVLGQVWDLHGEALPAALDVQCAGDAELRTAVELRLVERPQKRDGAAADGERPSRLALSVSGEVGKPTAIGEYAVLEEIGAGGFGVVYLGRHRRAGYLVAIKVPKAGSPAARSPRWFEREAKAASRLDHPNIVRVRHVDALPDGTPYIVSDFVKGQSLRTCLDRGETFTPGAARALVIKVCKALSHAHKEGIVHGDLTPANILIDYTGEPKVTDFGLACGIGEDEATLGGTRDYMSPEVLNGAQRGPTQRSDLWAVGVIFYELLAQRRPFSVACKDGVWVFDPPHPVPPRKIDRSVPSSINHMCMRFFLQ